MTRWPRRRPGHPYLAGSPLLIAHRGGARLAPENTIAAFRNAIDAWGADMLEMDVRATRDGEVVVIHDETVDRTTEGTGPVASLTWAHARELDAGYRFRDLHGDHSFRGEGVRIPRFEEVLEELPGVRLNVEAKDGRSAQGLVEAVLRHGAQDRVLVAAEWERNRRRVRGYPGPWGASRRNLAGFLLLARAPFGRFFTPGCDVLQVPLEHRGFRILTRRFLAESHRRNLPVHAWTVDDPEDMRRLLAWGVDGIQTDRPDLLAGILTEVVGRPPPPALRGRLRAEALTAPSGPGERQS
jgi:glycerophosphoryl diester phosphodiesterase